MDAGATVRIRIDSKERSLLVVNRRLLSFWSSCAEGLPDDAAEWDLSQLQIEGKPVQRSIVIAWLNIIFKMVCGTQFEQQNTDPRTDATCLAQLLAFADAVGSPTGVVVECLTQLRQLKYTVSFTDEFDELTEVRLPADGRCYWRSDGRGLRVSSLDMLVSVPSAQVKQEFTQQAVSATESLLYLAYKLQLPDLQKVLGTWVRLNSAQSRDLLTSVMGDVVSSRVLAAAASDEQLLRQLVLTSLTKP